MPIGLDVGHRLVKLAVVEGSAKAPKVVLYAQKRVPYAEDPDRYERNRIETIGALLSEHGLAGRPVIVNMDASNCLIRLITVNLTQKEQIDKTILYTIEGYLPGISIDEVIVDYHIVETMDSGSKILTIAVPKKNLGATLHFYEDAGVEVPAIGLDCFSLFNACKAAGYTESEEASLVLDLGADDCKLMLIDQGEIKLVRAAKVGTFSGTRTLARARRESPETLEDRVESGERVMIGDGGESDAAELDEWQEQYLDKVAAEVTRTALRINLATPIRTVYLTGGGSRMPNAVPHLRAKLGMDVELLDLAGRLNVESTQQRPESFNAHAGVAIGAALKGIGFDHHGTDFRQGEFRYERRFQQIQKSLALACGLLLLLFGVVAFAQFRKLKGLETVRDAVEAKEKEFWTLTFDEDGEPFPGFGKVRSRIGNLKTTMEARVGDINGQEKKVSALIQLYEFLALTQTDKLRYKYRIMSLQLNQKDSKFILEVDDPKTATELQKAVKDSQIIVASTPQLLRKQDRTRAEYWEATLDISLRKEAK